MKSEREYTLSPSPLCSFRAISPISACCAEAQFKGRIFFSAGKVPMLSVKLKKAEDPLKLATQLVGVYAALRAQTAGT